MADEQDIPDVPEDYENVISADDTDVVIAENQSTEVDI